MTIDLHLAFWVMNWRGILLQKFNNLALLDRIMIKIDVPFHKYLAFSLGYSTFYRDSEAKARRAIRDLQGVVRLRHGGVTSCRCCEQTMTDCVGIIESAVRIASSSSLVLSKR